jgi:DNA-binding NarL/FixJ family response regulator
MGHRLGIEPATVHTHLQRLYSRLDVHSAQEAILRSFELRLIDWLDLPSK